MEDITVSLKVFSSKSFSKGFLIFQILTTVTNLVTKTGNNSLFVLTTPSEDDLDFIVNT